MQFRHLFAVKLGDVRVNFNGLVIVVGRQHLFQIPFPRFQRAEFVPYDGWVVISLSNKSQAAGNGFVGLV